MIRLNNLLLKFKLGLLGATIILLVISSCKSTVENEWDCPAVRGKVCHTISMSDKLANAAKKDENTTKSATPDSKKLINPDSTRLFELPKRQGEQIARLWFSPYIDRDGNLHDHSVVYIIESDNNWVLFNDRSN